MSGKDDVLAEGGSSPPDSIEMVIQANYGFRTLVEQIELLMEETVVEFSELYLSAIQGSAGISDAETNTLQSIAGDKTGSLFALTLMREAALFSIVSAKNAAINEIAAEAGTPVA